MSENDKQQPKESKAEGAPARAGRQQLGEKSEGVTTTRVPRGVGELPADAKAGAKGVRLTQESIQKQVDEETEKGYRGQQVSQVPNENYTVQGVLAGKPTPETTVHTPRGQ